MSETREIHKSELSHAHIGKTIRATWLTDDGHQAEVLGRLQDVHFYATQLSRPVRGASSRGYESTLTQTEIRIAGLGEWITPDRMAIED